MGPSVESLLTISSPWRMGTWWHDARSAMLASGQWLSNYHALGCQIGCPALQLQHYVSRRSAMLACLEPEEKRALLDFLGAGTTGPMVIAHSDYTPHNILFAGGRICAIDYGVLEWDWMSPFWDYACFSVAVARTFAFCRRSPGYWIRAVSRHALGAFEAGYGRSVQAEPMFWASVVVRHLLFASAGNLDLGGGMASTRDPQGHASIV